MILLHSRRRRWENNIEMVTQKEWGCVEWTYLARGGDEWGGFFFYKSSNGESHSIKCGEFHWYF